MLEKMNYIGYHEDGKEQDVGLVNEREMVRSRQVVSGEQGLPRPMTGKLLP